MKFNELLEAWEFGAIISYRHLRYEQFIGAYDVNKVDNLKTLFYRQGVKFKVHK
ncbi:MAG: hypothetical protein PF440_08840 [Thiomicrorhabdus sp.]|jgi:hypothetical protein|nr:hypothetical protein [Thiomicrorhabdus sp.]